MRRSANCANGCGGRPTCRSRCGRCGPCSADWTRGRGAFPGTLEALPDTAHGAAFGELPRRRPSCFGIFVCADLLRKPYCYIDGVAVYDAEVAMQTTVYLESFSALEESGRMVDELIENN